MLGILGGTFDPIHYGHLRAGLEVMEDLHLQALHILPSHVPPHRPQPLASPAQRLAMVELAIAGQAGWVLDRRELQRSEPSYTVVTLEAMRREMGNQQPLALLLGADAFAGLAHWHQWQRLAQLTHIVVLQRPGVVLSDLAVVAAELGFSYTQQLETLHSTPAGCLWWHAGTPLMISATAIRARVAQGHSVRFLLPDGVNCYIQEQRLYT